MKLGPFTINLPEAIAGLIAACLFYYMHGWVGVIAAGLLTIRYNRD